jgi:hypothetical protein
MSNEVTLIFKIQESGKSINVTRAQFYHVKIENDIKTFHYVGVVCTVAKK